MCRVSKYSLVCEKVATYSTEQTALHSPDDVAEFLVRTVGTDGLMTEHFFVFCLNTRCRVIGFFDIASGCIDGCPVHPREVFQPAVAMPKTAAIIVAHNHPSGNPRPSEEDLDVTKRLVSAGRLLGIKVLDHAVVGDGIWCSLKQDGFAEF